MAYASKAGRSRASIKNPIAQAVCFRCGMWYPRNQLVFQTDWRGTSLRNLYILVCTRTCLDRPQEQLRAIVLPADPVPVYFPSVEQFEYAESDYRSLAETTTDPVTGIPVPSTTLRVTQDCENRITQPIGAPRGLSQDAVMPYSGAAQKAFCVPLSIVSVMSNGTATITATCSKAHNLCAGAQISAAGLTSANGIYTVAVVNPMIFTWDVAPLVPTASLLTSTTRIVTALVGIPYGAAEVPVT